MNVVRSRFTSPMIERDASLGTRIVSGLDGPERVPQPVEQLTREQYNIAHAMSCMKVGCLRCAA